MLTALVLNAIADSLLNIYQKNIRAYNYQTDGEYFDKKLHSSLCVNCTYTLESLYTAVLIKNIPV